MNYLLENWQNALIVLIVLAVLGGLFSLLFLKRMPAPMSGFIEYFNFRTSEKEPATVFGYSKFLRSVKCKWQFFFTGKREGLDIYYGIFEYKRNFYNFLSIKSEVKPAIITDMKNLSLDYSFQSDMDNLRIYSKDNYMLENIQKSDDFILGVQDLFRGKNNLIEFTDLNQVLILTDYTFNTAKEMNEYFAKFRQLKEKL
jgi:hypothetical protein